MKLSADHHFVIGHDHVLSAKPCQDHALSHSGEGFALALVADGCSSGGATDMGARLTNFMLMRALTRVSPAEDSVKGVLSASARRLVRVARSLALGPSDILATSLVALLTPSWGYVRLSGDGVIARKLFDGTLVLARYEWANNMPFYPAYGLHERDVERFIAAHGGDIDAPLFREERWVRTHGGVFVKDVEAEHSLRLGIKGVSFSLTQDEVSETNALALFSDGVTSVEGVDWKDAAARLLEWKTLPGAFVKRRVSRSIKEFTRFGRGPLDDIAIAAITRTLDTERDEKGGDHEHHETAA